MGPLLDACSKHGLSPLPTACDGDCAIDVLGFWQGKRDDIPTRRGLRAALVASIAAHAEEDKWLELYDLSGVPDWKAKARTMASEEQGLRASGAACSESLPATGAACREDDLSESELLDAMAWVCGAESQRDRPADDYLRSLAESLAEEERQGWRKRWRDHVEKPPQSPPRAKKAPMRRNRSYPLRQTVAAARDFRVLVNAHGIEGRLPSGMLQTFLQKRGMHADMQSLKHFRRVFGGLTKRTALALAGPSRDRAPTLKRCR
ncbi:MAG: hypothetical protein GY772_27160, partial [bacterium]|nr:hypothetical protein [bacterium]